MFGIITTEIVSVSKHLYDESGVNTKSYVPATSVMIVSGDHVPIIPFKSVGGS